MNRIKKIEELDAEITAPPSKSISHRAIFLASLAKGESIIRNVLKSDDINFTKLACSNLGGNITEKGGDLSIIGTDGNLHIKKDEIYVGNSGTTMRFLTSFACLLKSGDLIIYGIERMHERPIKQLVSSLRDLGANVEYLKNKGYPPLLIHGRGLKGGKTRLRGDVSSQFFSSLLISCPKALNDTSIYFEKPLKSKPYIDLTIDVIEKFNGSVDVNEEFYFIPAQQDFKSRTFKVEGDFSSISYFLSMAAVLKGKIKIFRGGRCKPF